MLTFTNLEKNKIKDFIKNTLKNSNLEFEVRLTPQNNGISQEDFVNVIKKIKSKSFKNVSVTEMSLDIYLKEYDSMRLTVHGDDNIGKYCHENSIQNISDSIEYIDKTRFSIGKIETRPLDLRNYDLRVNLKEEKLLTDRNKTVQQIKAKLPQLHKAYRYKKRFSFISDDKLFKYDLTIIKSSNKDVITKEKRNVAKSEVNEKMKRHVVKPKGISESFTTWWNSLNSDAIVTLREFSYEKEFYFKNLKDSETLTNHMTYEIEVEFIGNKDKTLLEDKTQEDRQKLVYEQLQEHLQLILSATQKSDFIISKTEQKTVKYEFQKLTGLYNFTSSIPNAITLERSNIQDTTDLTNITNIRKNYSVTEKTDGERNLLFVNSSGEVFLINRQNLVRKVGLKIPNYPNTLLDGELVSQNLNGNPMRLYLTFDLYFSKGIDFRERILMRSLVDKSENKYDKSRLEELDDMVQQMELESEDSDLEFVIEKKIFKFGNVEEDSEDIRKLVEEREEYLLNHNQELTELSIQKLNQDITLAKQNNKIFEESQKILIQIESQQYNYGTDGLIFTPIYMTVGEGETKKNKYGGRWKNLFKWKPIEENSIDFQVNILKEEDGRHVEKYITVGNDLVSYKKVKLLVGYEKNLHQLMNGLRVLNEDLKYLDGYNIIPFEPLHPFANKIYETNIKVENNGLVCKNGDIIRDGNIVEFSFDLKGSNGFNWIPMRVRDSKLPNAFSTACNVWNTIFNPITTEMISTGQNIPSHENYYNHEKKNDGTMKQVYKFHNAVKNNLLQTHVKSGHKLLDLACGEMGDLQKYLTLDLSLLVGVDNNKYNLINENSGALKRVLGIKNKKIKEEQEVGVLDRTFLIWGNGGENLSSAQAGLDSLNKFYLDVLWGNVINRKHIERLGNPKLKEVRGVCEEKFDIICCQFALHYFFENSKTLNNFMMNISENLKIGGKLLATFFDGRKIFDILENSEKVEKKNSQGKLLWRINKKYKENILPKDQNCLFMPIEVYIETFSQSFLEYLVNLDYLRDIFELYGLEITSVKSFEDHYQDLGLQTLDDDQKIFSFLNTSLVVTKKKEITEMSGGGKKNVLDIFISNQEKLGGGVEEEKDILDTDVDYSDDEVSEDLETQQGGEEELEDEGSELGEVIEDVEEIEPESRAIEEVETEGEVKTESKVEAENVLDGGDKTSSKILDLDSEETNTELKVMTLKDLDLELEPENTTMNPENNPLISKEGINMESDYSNLEVGNINPTSGDILSDKEGRVDTESLRDVELDLGKMESVNLTLETLNNSIQTMKQERNLETPSASEEVVATNQDVKVIKIGENVAGLNLLK